MAMRPASGSNLLTQDEVDFITSRWVEDPKLFATMALQIAPKEKAESGVIPLNFTYIQDRTNDIAEQMRFLGVAERFINAKARQVKLTTYWLSRAYWYHWRSPGPRQTDLMGDISQTTETMKMMWDTYYEYLPYYAKRPVTSLVTHKFKDTKARIREHTALTPRKRPVQGSTSSSIIATEVPYYSHGEKLLLAMLNALPGIPGTLGVLEGTANGAAGAFYERWLAAIARVEQLCKEFGAIDGDDLLFNRSGWGYKTDKYGHTHPNGYWDGSWYPLFWGWWQNPEYVRDPELEDVAENNLTDDEHQAIEQFNLSWAQVSWYRYALRDLAGGDEKLLKQEYPATWQEAFMFSGRTVFDTKTVSFYIQRTEALQRAFREVTRADGSIRKIPYIQRVSLNWKEDTTPSPNNRNAPIFDAYGHCTNKDQLRVEAEQNHLGEYFFRRMPRGGWTRRYVIGADVAEGLEQGDFSTAFVYDRVNARFEMMLQIHADEELFAEMLAKMGVFYHFAGVLVEQNKQGDAVINALKRIYRNVLVGTRFEKGQVVTGRRLGWLTTHQSKPQMVGKLKGYMRDHADGMEFYLPWKEANSFTQEANGSMGAEGKRLDPSSSAYDDLVMAWCITLMADAIWTIPEEVKQSRDMVDIQEQKKGKVKLLHNRNFS